MVLHGNEDRFHPRRARWGRGMWRLLGGILLGGWAWPAEAQVAKGPPPDMVLIPAGTFVMGTDLADDEAPPHEVFLPDFYIDRHEVTVAEYRARRPYFALPGRENHPVTAVTWADAEAYCKSVGKRLPTEAEWEKACRGTQGYKYPWGNVYREGLQNSVEAGIGGTAPVGSFPGGASPYGVLDMAGNVWEWTADWYRPYPGSEARSDEFGETHRVIRGGAFSISGKVSRCSNRFTSRPELDSQDIGFRCARSR